eukprot:5017041-Prymnesium_polylepis.1
MSSEHDRFEGCCGKLWVCSRADEFGGGACWACNSAPHFEIEAWTFARAMGKPGWGDRGQRWTVRGGERGGAGLGLERSRTPHVVEG